MIRATLKLVFVIAWILICLPPLWLAVKMKKPVWRNRIYSFGSMVILPIIGLRVTIEGKLESRRPLLLVSNHLSYLDILILGSKTPVHFTAKSDMARWPLISTICKLNGAVFVERTADKIKDTSQQIVQTLEAGEVVSLFPEGTTGNGRHLLPFKSSLLNIAEEHLSNGELLIQPAAIVYQRIGMMPIDSTDWPKVAWYGDMSLLPHLWEFLQLRKVDVKLIFLPATTLRECGDRKQLAHYCQEQVAQALDNSRF